MTRVTWRWEARDFGFRFRSGKGKSANEFYQAQNADEFYVVPTTDRKLKKARADELARGVAAPVSSRVIANPWRNYSLDWDWIDNGDSICLNYAGCLEKAEIERREDLGVQRATELVLELLEFKTPAPMTVSTIQEIHAELMGEIYPFAGRWRTVSLHKGDGPTKWPLPPYGIEPLMNSYGDEVLTRTPFISANDTEIFTFISELMNELLAIHPFREGNGRTVFILANMVLMQNDMLPLNIYDRKSDEKRYFAACEAGRLKKDYAPLAALLAEWEAHTLAKWEADHGSQ
jgi:cell filamentation protein